MSFKIVLYKFINGILQRVDRFLIAFFYSVDDAVIDVVCKYELACIVQGGNDRGKLDEYFRAVSAVLYHFRYRLKMS